MSWRSVALSGLVIFTPVAVCAKTEPAYRSGIAVSDAYKKWACKQERDSVELQTAISDEEIRELVERMTADGIEEGAKAPDPFPAEILDYVPTAYELAEWNLGWQPCGQSFGKPLVSLPVGFRCRLDRMVFRDVGSKRELQAAGGYAAFNFIYDDEKERVVLDQPRALRHEPFRVGGVLMVRGRFQGKVYSMLRVWTAGSPPQIHESRLTSNRPEDAVMPPARLPYVTAQNASMFVFDFPRDSPATREEYGGPLKAFTFVPYRCQ